MLLRNNDVSLIIILSNRFLEIGLQTLIAFSFSIFLQFLVRGKVQILPFTIRFLVFCAVHTGAMVTLYAPSFPAVYTI